MEKKKQKLIQRHILLPKEIDDKILEIAEKEDMKITAIIRRAVREFLERKKKQ